MMSPQARTQLSQMQALSCTIRLFTSSSLRPQKEQRSGSCPEFLLLDID